MKMTVRWSLLFVPVAAVLTACAADPEPEKKESTSQPLCYNCDGTSSSSSGGDTYTFTCPTSDCHYKLSGDQCMYYDICGSGKTEIVGTVYNPCPSWSPNYTCNWYGYCYCY